MSNKIVETAIIGGGQAGVPLARALFEVGRSVMLFEREHLGGSCVNFGCTPSKALIASARMASDARRAAELGVRIAGVTVDFPAVMARVRRIVADATGSLNASFGGPGQPPFVAAHARLDGKDGARFRLRAGDTVMLAERVVLDTGTRSAFPEIEGLDPARCITAENWVDLDTLPERLIVLGGSYVAVEMAQAFRRLGSAVTLVQHAGHLVEREDSDVSHAISEALESDGVEVILDARTASVRHGDGVVTLHLPGRTISGTHLFLATGRKPNTDDLGLESVGLAPDKSGFIEVDAALASKVAGIWAVGDIRGGPAFTHTAYADFRVLQSAFLGDGSVRRPSVIPYAIFADPELGRVGMSETEARKSGRKLKIGRYKMSDSGKAREMGRTAGFAKVILDADTDEILGVAILGLEAAETVQIFIEMMNLGGAARTMVDAVHIHPTMAEAAKNALVAAVGA